MHSHKLDKSSVSSKYYTDIITVKFHYYTISVYIMKQHGGEWEALVTWCTVWHLTGIWLQALARTLLCKTLKQLPHTPLPLSSISIFATIKQLEGKH